MVFLQYVFFYVSVNQIFGWRISHSRHIQMVSLQYVFFYVSAKFLSF